MYAPGDDSEKRGKKASAARGNNLQLLVEVARAYYEQEHDQGSIAASLGISRSQLYTRLVRFGLEG